MNFNQQFIAATVLVSFLPFVRSEGNMMLPLFALILLLRGQWKCLPLLAFGTVLYSIIGYFYYHDLFWIKTQNPYTGQNFDIYGSGELLRFVKGLSEIIGYPLIVLFVLKV